MKDHEKRELVNRLTALALAFAETQQLRARIAGEVLPAIAAAEAAERERWRIALGACDAALALCQPCAEPDCRAVQREYIDEARAAAAGLLRA